MEKLQINSHNKDSLSNSLGRLSTFFHEARHSDGNGKSLGFFHAICPVEHDLAGRHACDRNLNGPYTVGAQMLKEFYKNCQNCYPSELELMKLKYLESLGRVIKVTKKPKSELPSEKMELLTGVLKYKNEIALSNSINYSLAELKRLDQDINQIKINIMKLHEESDNLVEIPSTYWDATPEGHR